MLHRFLEMLGTRRARCDLPCTSVCVMISLEAPVLVLIAGDNWTGNTEKVRSNCNSLKRTYEQAWASSGGAISLNCGEATRPTYTVLVRQEPDS